MTSSENLLTESAVGAAALEWLETLGGRSSAVAILSRTREVGRGEATTRLFWKAGYVMLLIN